MIARSASGATYSAVQNPTAAVAKANQAVATQSPLMVIQATSGGGFAVAATNTRYSGNLGGIAGANAICAAEFGAGWRFANPSQIAAIGGEGLSLGMPGMQKYWVKGEPGWPLCQSWTASDGTNQGYTVEPGVNTTTYYSVRFLSFDYHSTCNNFFQVMCANF